MDYPSFILATGDGRCLLELLPQHGGIINALTFAKVNGQPFNCIWGCTSLSEIESDAFFRGIPLYPFANRLDQGRYDHLGNEYQLEVNEVTRDNTLHGFIQHLPVNIRQLEQSETHAVAEAIYEYDGSVEGYPFPASIHMIYTLRSPGELALELSIKNKHSAPVPVGAGWHPYFKMDEAVNDLSLQLPASKQVVVNERLLPTGETADFKAFDSLRKIGDTAFDTCFELINEAVNPDIEKVIIYSESSKIGLEIWQETGAGKYNYIQVCIPPDRKSIAVEPVSCGINAFNTKQGLSILAPGETWSAKCGVRFKQQTSASEASVTAS